MFFTWFMLEDPTTYQLSFWKKKTFFQEKASENNGSLMVLYIHENSQITKVTTNKAGWYIH